MQEGESRSSNIDEEIKVAIYPVLLVWKQDE